MVPGPKARMQASAARRPTGRRASFNGARPEGQDAGDRLRESADNARPLQWCPARRPGCRARRSPTWRAPSSCFNGARPEGQDAGIWGTDGPPGRGTLQWCPARRPGCRTESGSGSNGWPTASMVPGPKARMQVVVVLLKLHRIVLLQWCPARRPGCRPKRRLHATFVLQLQWCPARRPGCRR